MRMSKVVAALLAIVLALTVAITVAVTVDAAAAGRHPRHNLKIDAKELNSANRFVLFGKVPTYPGRQIVLTRSLNGGKYHPLKKIKTSHNGRFRVRIFQVPRTVTCFKVVVPATAHYRRTTSKGASCIKSRDQADDARWSSG